MALKYKVWREDEGEETAREYLESNTRSAVLSYAAWLHFEQNNEEDEYEVFVRVFKDDDTAPVYRVSVETRIEFDITPLGRVKDPVVIAESSGV
jgi:hypothetical protein